MEKTPLFTHMYAYEVMSVCTMYNVFFFSIILGGHFFFKVKFYVSDPSKLQEEYTRYQFYLQIRRDILQGKLQLPSSTACLIASYTVQCKYFENNDLISFSLLCHLSESNAQNNKVT